jgi:hypothetical protein
VSHGQAALLSRVAALAAADAAGRFRLENPPDSSVSLRVTVIGYAPVTHSVPAGNYPALFLEIP